MGKKSRVLEVRLAVSKPFALFGEDCAAGGFKHRLTGSGIPFVRAAKTGVEITGSFGEIGEFQGASDGASFLCSSFFKI